MNDQPSRDTPHLLLVEDEPDTAELVTLIMKEQGYHVVHAPDGQVALEKIALMPAPSLVLLYIQLPHVDGIAILETIRATPDWEHVPVVMLTGVTDPQSIKKAAALKVQEYVLKPFKRETLLSYVERARTRSAHP
ncbi:MAG: response regulator [Nitrospira sp.]|nr:response regulator [Nitrospira sp.]MDH5725611.1 response regulator [Nitrospira sp.]